MEQWEGETAGPSGKAAEGGGRLELVADSEDIRCTVAVAAEPGSCVAALDLDSLYIDSGALHRRDWEVAEGSYFVADDLAAYLRRRIGRMAWGLGDYYCLQREMYLSLKTF